MATCQPENLPDNHRPYHWAGLAHEYPDLLQSNRAAHRRVRLPEMCTRPTKGTAAMKTMSLADFHATLRAQGVPRDHLAFRCPMCQTVQSANDLITAGAGKDFEEVDKYLGFSCVGRFTNAGSPSASKGKGIGCNWTLGGMFQMHGLEVITEDGKHHPQFEPVTPEEAQAHQVAKA